LRILIWAFVLCGIVSFVVVFSIARRHARKAGGKALSALTDPVGPDVGQRFARSGHGGSYL
jgi:hypothetical protein